jgi:hypothetical protein
VVAVILMVMGLQLSGLINLKLGGASQKFLPQRTGLIGALILGALFGLVLSPCASPVLAVILTMAAVKGEVAYGSTLLFAYALGQGTLIILAVTFTGVIEGFPGNLGCGGSEPRRTNQAEPGGVYHPEQGLRLQRQERPGCGRLGEPDVYRDAAGVAEAH